MAGAGSSGQGPSAAFDAFVDEFLETLSARHPSIAAGNGLHAHDGSLEDFSAAAIERELAGWRALKARLATIPVSSLSPDQQVDHRIVDGLLDAWLLDLDGNKNWRKNPMIYAAAISDGVHILLTMHTAP